MLGQGRVCAEVDPLKARSRTWHLVEGAPAAPVPPRATSSNSGAPETPLVCPYREDEPMAGTEFVATVDLRGGAGAVDLEAPGRPACRQKRSQAPVLALK
jgi:hypothetical protein